jgi:ubiquinone/menaquinone biosynthesis C-methylase UbiE
MTTEYLATQWGSVDKSTHPQAFVEYLDRVGGLAAIRRIKGWMRDTLQIREGDRLLDVGCGLGEDVKDLSLLVGNTGRVVGIDTSETMLAEARNRAAGLNLPVEFRVGNAQNLDIPENMFDGCRAERVFVHLRTPERALAEMARVARPGARIVVYDADWETLVVDAPDRAVTRKILNSLCDSGGSRWIGRQLRRMFVEVGLAQIDVLAETLVFTDYDQADQAFQLKETAIQAQIAGTVTPAQANRWLSAFETAQQRGTFFAAATGFCVRGCKP